MKPRNSKQIANLQQNERSKSRLTHDALYNLHELAYDLRPFVVLIKTFPDVLIVCGHGSLAEELDGLLQAESEVPQLLSYDTTFQLGDFYLSVFLFRHTTFSSSPVIPCFFLIHERKFQSCHEELMREIAKKSSKFGKRKKGYTTSYRRRSWYISGNLRHSDCFFGKQQKYYCPACQK